MWIVLGAMSVNSSVTPNAEEDGATTMVSSILVVFLVLLSLLMAVLVAIVVYQIFIRWSTWRDVKPAQRGQLLIITDFNQ